MKINIDILIKALNNYKETTSNNLELTSVLDIYKHYLKNNAHNNDNVYILPENFIDLNLDDIEYYSMKLYSDKLWLKYPEYISSLLKEYGDYDGYFSTPSIKLQLSVHKHKSKFLNTYDKSYHINIIKPIIIQDKLEFEWTIPNNIKDIHLLTLFNNIKALKVKEDEFVYNKIISSLPEELKSIAIFD